VNRDALTTLSIGTYRPRFNLFLRPKKSKSRASTPHWRVLLLLATRKALRAAANQCDPNGDGTVHVVDVQSIRCWEFLQDHRGPVRGAFAEFANTSRCAADRAPGPIRPPATRWLKTLCASANRIRPALLARCRDGGEGCVVESQPQHRHVSRLNTEDSRASLTYHTGQAGKIPQGSSRFALRRQHHGRCSDLGAGIVPNGNGNRGGLVARVYDGHGCDISGVIPNQCAGGGRRC